MNSIFSSIFFFIALFGLLGVVVGALIGGASYFSTIPMSEFMEIVTSVGLIFSSGIIGSLWMMIWMGITKHFDSMLEG